MACTIAVNDIINTMATAKLLAIYNIDDDITKGINLGIVVVVCWGMIQTVLFTISDKEYVVFVWVTGSQSLIHLNTIQFIKIVFIYWPIRLFVIITGIRSNNENIRIAGT